MMKTVQAVGILMLLPAAASATCLPDETKVTLQGGVTSARNSVNQPYYSLSVGKAYCVSDPDTGGKSPSTKSLFLLGKDKELAAFTGQKVTVVGRLTASGNTVTMLQVDKITQR